MVCGLTYLEDLLSFQRVPQLPFSLTRIQGFILSNRVVYERAQKTEEIIEQCKWAHLDGNHSNHIILWFIIIFLTLCPNPQL